MTYDETSLCSTIDLVSLAVENYVPSLLTDLENARRRLLEGSMNQPTPDVPIQDVFALYRRTKSMLGLLKAFCPQRVTPPVFCCNLLG